MHDVEVTFDGHFERFKPTLDEIKKSASESLPLRHRIDTDLFFTKDFRNLCENSKKQGRCEYYNTLEGPRANTTTLENFDRILYSEKNGFNFENVLVEFGEQMNSCSGVYLQQTIRSSQVFRSAITKHPEYQLLVETIENSFKTLNQEDLNFLLINLEKNEFLSLAIFEPYLISILPIGVFLSIVYPLHDKGVFKKVLSNAIKKQLIFRESFHQKLITFTNRSLYYINIIEPLLIKVNRMISYSPIVSTSIGTTVFGFCSKQLYEIFINSKKQPALVKPGRITEIVEKELEKGQGLESEAVDNSIKLISKVAFDAGRLWVSPASSFLRGLMYGAKDNIKEAAKVADEQLSNPDSVVSKNFEEFKGNRKKN